MKLVKLFAVGALCAITLFANAAITSKAKITVSSVGGGNDVLLMVEDNTASDAFESGMDIMKLMNPSNGTNINFYAVTTVGDLSSIVTNALSNIALTFKSNETETDYTMTFSGIVGTVKLYDAVTGTETVLANSGTYNFTCAANSTIADRFFINYVPAAPEICHRYGKLQVTGMKDTNVVVKNMDDSATSIGTVAITANYQEIDLAGLAAGQYKVEYNDGTAHTVIIDVK